MSSDVLVIGGGPAGLAAAIAAAQHGLRVTVAETCPGPLDKCCGEGLLPPAIAALGQLGVPLERLLQCGSPIRGIAFARGQQEAIAELWPGQVALGVRRTTLHPLLLARAQALGVCMVPHKAALAVDGRIYATRLAGREHPARWIIGADGAQSAVRRAAGLEPGRLTSKRFGVRQHFVLRPGTPAPDRVWVHWAPGAQAYVTPVGPGHVGIAVLSRNKFAGMAEALRRFPALDALLEGAAAASRPRGAISSHRTLRAVQRGPVALVGDAAGGVDAITGDGLSLAFGQALALGDALAAGDLRLYQAAHTRLLRPARLLSRTLLTMAAHPALESASVAALAHVPGLFRTLLRVHAAGPLPAGHAPWLPAPASTS